MAVIQNSRITLISVTDASDSDNPMAWSGVVDDGRMIYAKYSLRYLHITISENPTSTVADAIAGNDFFHQELSPDEIDLPLLKTITRKRITWPV